MNVVRSWQYVLRERYQRLWNARPSPYPASWSVPSEDLKDVSVRWPLSHLLHEEPQWLYPILFGLKHYVPVEIVPIEQTRPPANLFELVRKGKRFSVTIDPHDFMDLIEESALAKSIAYFKLQYRGGGYGDDRIVPGGYINRSEHYWQYLSWLRPVQNRNRPEFDVYGRFSLEFAPDVRKRAVRMLQEQTRFRFEGSLKTVRYTRSLEEAALSRICVDLPGNGDFCFRLFDYLGIGACVVAAPHRTMLPIPLENKKHIVYAKADLTDLVELCDYYLTHEAERLEIARNSREYWDRYLHPHQLGAYYLSTILQKIKES